MDNFTQVTQRDGKFRKITSIKIIWTSITTKTNSFLSSKTLNNPMPMKQTKIEKNMFNRYKNHLKVQKLNKLIKCRIKTISMKTVKDNMKIMTIYS
jgi:hypothetical protein